MIYLFQGIQLRLLIKLSVKIIKNQKNKNNILSTGGFFMKSDKYSLEVMEHEHVCK
jgi:hypothetical protein